MRQLNVIIATHEEKKKLTRINIQQSQHQRRKLLPTCCPPPPRPPPESTRTSAPHAPKLSKQEKYTPWVPAEIRRPIVACSAKDRPNMCHRQDPRAPTSTRLSRAQHYLCTTKNKPLVGRYGTQHGNTPTVTRENVHSKRTPPCAVAHKALLRQLKSANVGGTALTKFARGGAAHSECRATLSGRPPVRRTSTTRARPCEKYHTPIAVSNTRTVIVTRPFCAEGLTYCLISSSESPSALPTHATVLSLPITFPTNNYSKDGLLLSYLRTYLDIFWAFARAGGPASVPPKRRGNLR